jgi:hypothetical protein
MIVKLGQPLEWAQFRSKQNVVKAIRITHDDFMYETKQGWMQGFRGQWLVEVGGYNRHACDDEHFNRLYIPMADDGGKS